MHENRPGFPQSNPNRTIKIYISSSLGAKQKITKTSFGTNLLIAKKNKQKYHQFIRPCNSTIFLIKQQKLNLKILIERSCPFAGESSKIVQEY